MYRLNRLIIPYFAGVFIKEEKKQKNQWLISL